MKYTSILILSLFSFFINNRLIAKNLPIPGCEIPLNFNVESIGFDSIKLSWNSGSSNSLPEYYEMRYRTILSDEVGSWFPVETQYPSMHNSITINYLEWNTMHQIQIRSKCKEITPSGYVQYIYSDWVELFVSTKSFTPDNCSNSDSTIYSFDNIDYDKFSLKISGTNTEELDYCGRRFILKIKDMTTGIEFQRLYSNSFFPIDNLSSATTYKIYIKELFDGCENDYYSSCDWKGPFTVITKDKGNLCSNFNAGVRCVGIDYIKVIFSPISYIPGLLNQVQYDNNLRVKIRYRIVGTNNWNEVIVYKGNNYFIEFLQRATTYEIEAALIKGDGSLISCNYLQLGTHTTLMFPESDTDGDGIPNGCDDNPNDINQDNPIDRNLLTLSCGVPGDTSVPNNNSLKDHIYQGDIIFIRGLPIQVLYAYGTQTFNGFGALSVPFSTKQITVSLNDIQVNTIGKIVSGSVTGVLENGFNRPSIELGYFTEDGENINDPNSLSYDDFCYPPPAQEFDKDKKYKNKDGSLSDTNPKGFTANKEYKGKPYNQGANNPQPYDPTRDPNCFNSDGIHLNGTKFDENGCSQDDYLDTTSVCYKNRKEPYSCISNFVNSNKGPITEAGTKLVNTIGENGLSIAIDCAIDSEKNKVKDSINVQTISCSKLRDTVKNNTLLVKQDLKLTFGPGEEMLQRKMSSKFKENPEPLQYGGERDFNQIELEDSHIRLFDCDKKENELVAEEKIFTDKKEKPILKDQLKLELKSLLLRLPENEAKLMDSLIKNGNQTILCDWLKEKIKEIVKKEQIKASQYQSLGLLDFNNKSIKTFFPKDDLKFPNYSTDYGLIVSNENTAININNEKLKEEQVLKNSNDIFNLLKNGVKEINGIDAAFYFEKIFNERELNNLFYGENSMSLPIKISKNVLGVQYDVYISSLTATPTETKFDAFLILNTPPSKKRIIFSATGVKFGPDGFSEAKLSLGNKVSLPISDVMRINLLPDQTYVKFDCNGFAGIGINAELEICRKYLTPLDTTDKVLPEPKMVTANFKIEMPAWGEFIVNFNIDPFAITGNEDISWRVKNVWLDFSDSQSPSGISFPSIYQSPMMLGNTVSPLWKGVFIDTIEVRLSSDFSSTGRTKIMARKVIIDEGGLSALAKVTPVLSIEEGRIGKWAFSIDTFNLAVCRNSFAGMGFNGKIELPLFDEQDKLGYTAIIERGGNYVFGIEMKKKLKVPLLKSGIVLSNSKIEIIKDNIGFYAKGTLSGDITIDSSFGKTPFNLNKIRFSNMSLSTRAPYFKPGIWSNLDSTAHGVNLAGFGLNISKIHPVENLQDNQTGVGFDLKLILGEGSNNLKVTSSLRIMGELEDKPNGKQRWEYKEFKIDGACVDGSFPGVENIKGCIKFFENDITWGTGFYGRLSMGISAIGLDNISVAGMFGRKPDFKYFFLDGLAVLKNGIGGGGFKLKAFGGGVYHHMSRDTLMSVLPNDLNKPLPDENDVGMSVTGIKYLPNIERSIGINAIIGFTGDIEKSYNGIANFWIDFNSGGGLNEIGIRGNIRMMASFNHNLSPYATCDTCPVFGKAEIIYNHTDGTLNANMVLIVNAAKGSITGNAWAQIHVDKTDFWLYVGTPKQPCFVKFSLGSFNLARTEFYLDLGTKIPEMKKLPNYVQDLVKLNTNDALSSVKSGGGFMFGMNLKLGDQNEKTFLIFYAKLFVELGFDFCLKEYKNISCDGHTGTIGMNGWYAKGQAYAYVDAKIGIKVKLWGAQKKFSILDISAAAALQLQFPNPFWATGAVAGRYSVLGGLVSGNCRFKFELGEKCVPVNSNGEPISQEYRVVQEFYPEPGTDSISPFDIPRIKFSLPYCYGCSYDNLEKSTLVIDQDAEGKDITARLEDISIELHKIGGSNIYVNVNDSRNWKNNHKEISINPLGDPLEVGDYQLVVTSYIIISNDKYNPIIQYDTLSFKVKSNGNLLPSSLIQYSYPIVNQYNYYKKISDSYGLINSGCIVIKKDISNFLKTDVKKYVANFYDQLSGGLISSNIVTFAIKDINGTKSSALTFTVPNDLLVCGNVYKLSIEEQKVGTNNLNVVMDYIFRVSQYPSLDSKLQALINTVRTNTVSPRSFVYKSSTGLDEPFDDYEINNLIFLRSNLESETSGLREEGGFSEADFSTTLTRAMYTHFPKYKCPLTWKKFYKYTNMNDIDEKSLVFVTNSDKPIKINNDNIFEKISAPQYVENSIIALANNDFQYLKALGSECDHIKRVNAANSFGDTLYNAANSYPTPQIGTFISMELIYVVPPMNIYGVTNSIRRKVGLRIN